MKDIDAAEEEAYKLVEDERQLADLSPAAPPLTPNPLVASALLPSARRAVSERGGEANQDKENLDRERVMALSPEALAAEVRAYLDFYGLPHTGKRDPPPVAKTYDEGLPAPPPHPGYYTEDLEAELIRSLTDKLPTNELGRRRVHAKSE